MALNSTKRIVVICAPTGFGKSGVADAIANLSKKVTAIVTNSRGLQDQYMADFGQTGLVDIRGRNNYKCDSRPDDPEYTCESGYEARCPYKGSIACNCSKAEIAASVSTKIVTNYSKWCAARKFSTGLAHVEQVIFDEAHHMYDALSESMQVILNTYEIEKGLKIDFLKGHESEDMMYWKAWATRARSECEQATAVAQARITGITDPKPAWVKHYTHMKNLLRRLSILSTCNPADWIVEELGEAKGFQFDPIRPGRYVESGLLMRVPKIICISATVRPKTMYMCGIAEKNFDYIEFDSEFDPKRSPIYYVPTMRVDKRAPSLLPIWMMLDRIASARPNRSGIVHTISYDRQQEIKAVSRHTDRMIVNPKGDAPTEKIEEFCGKLGSILVSPSVGEGYDFPDDLCRWQMVCKVPFEPPSRILKAREADDKEYGPYRAMQKLVQMFGRDMRHKGDWSERFIGDEHMEWFKPRFAHLAPRSFNGVYKKVEILPQALDPGRL